MTNVRRILPHSSSPRLSPSSPSGDPRAQGRVPKTQACATRQGESEFYIYKILGEEKELRTESWSAESPICEPLKVRFRAHPMVWVPKGPGAWADSPSSPRFLQRRRPAPTPLSSCLPKVRFAPHCRLVVWANAALRLPRSPFHSTSPGSSNAAFDDIHPHSWVACDSPRA
jgi:hypothetical protein